MPALDLHLAAFLMDFAEQAGVLNRKPRLRRKSPEQIDRSLWKFSRLPAVYDQKARDHTLPQQRCEKDGPIARIQNAALRRALRLIAEIRNLDGFLPCQRQSHVPVADIELVPGKRRYGDGIHAVGCAQ